MNRKERRRQERMTGAVTPHQSKSLNLAKARVRAAEQRLSQGDPVGAAEAIKEVHALDPDNARAWYLSAMIAFNAGNLEEASDAIVKATANENTDPEAHANCSAIMNLCGRPLEAEAAARYAIELSETMPEAHCNLGVALEAQGKVDEAAEALSYAIELKPDYVEAYISLGNLMYRRGDYMASADAFAEAVTLQPENPMAHTNLGVALRALGELSAAERYCRAAIELNPGYAEAYNALGNVLRDLGDGPGAVSAFRSAVENRETYPEARVNLAAAQFKIGEFDAAEASYADAMSRHPDFAEAAHGLGVVRLARGKTEEATSVFREAVAKRESFGEAWMNIVDAEGEEFPEEDMAILRTRSEDTRLADDDRTAFLFALGSAEDKRGNYDAAASAFEKANRRRRAALNKAGFGFDPDAFDAEIDHVIRAFENWPSDELKTAGDNEANLVFICGMPRSGTSLVEQILGAHPKVFGAGEVDILSGLLDDYPSDLTTLDENHIRDLADLYLSRLPTTASDDVFVTDKTPKNIFFVGLIGALFPNAKVIRCQRDRRDVALSCYFQNFKSVGMDWTFDLEHIERFARAEQRMAEFWTETKKLPILTINYENVVSDLDAETARLCEFVGVDMVDAMRAPHTSDSTVLTASNWQVRKPIYSKSMNRWKNYEAILEFPTE